ncbi:hypothetical protein ScPMuIL_009377 [Solemya velum]
MPPKRKAQTAVKAGGKKAKAGANTLKDAIENLKKADVGKKKTHKPDASCPLKAFLACEVLEDFDCMLNQTNIGHNNNKYYIIQVLQMGSNYYAWNRWGRVGEPGANALKGPIPKDDAIKDFKKKFQDKTRNKWENRSNFQAVPGKYTMLDMAGEEDDDGGDQIDAAIAAETKGKNIAKSNLDGPTQKLIKLIFDTNMFREAMQKLDIDVKKMPLGKLSKTQIAKGFECLENLEDGIKKKASGTKINELTSQFYTIIPHNFGRSVPPPIKDMETLQQKMDMLTVLADIELAQAMQSDKKKVKKAGPEEPNPLDTNYEKLACDLELMNTTSKEFKVLETYTNQTRGDYRCSKIQHIWKVNRSGEEARFAAHKSITNRKLLWHGTNVAVVAAILNSGLRIMPHSGGRVGKGIYFASENAKSAGYVSPAGKIGIMFLNEVALGKEYNIGQSSGSQTKAPSGYDSIVARGHQEPDPSKNTILILDGKKIIVPQAEPVPQPEYEDSHFDQSEYLVYKESQNRIRYLLMIEDEDWDD